MQGIVLSRPDETHMLAVGDNEQQFLLEGHPEHLSPDPVQRRKTMDLTSVGRIDMGQQQAKNRLDATVPTPTPLTPRPRTGLGQGMPTVRMQGRFH
jgi:hypothetical protein